MALSIGNPAPDFNLPADDGSTWSLSHQRGKRTLLVFYPGDETPTCTAQLCDYRDGIESFRGVSVDVVGISADDIKSHKKFKANHQLPFILLSDTDRNIARKYDAHSLIYGTKRAIYLIDMDGIIRYKHIESVPFFRRKREELLQAIEQTN